MKLVNLFKSALMVMVAMIVAVACTEPEIPDVPNDPDSPEEPQRDNHFDITVQEVHASTAITQVTPADDEMYYVMFLEEVSYLQNGGFTTSAKLWEDDYTAFEGGAINSNMNLKEYMVKSTIACQGIMRVQWNSVRPGVNSVLYVYGIKFAEDGASYEPVTEISWVTIKPDYAPLQDVAFDLDVKVSGADVVLGIKPECIIEKMTTALPVKFIPSSNKITAHGIIVEVDKKTKKAVSIERITF